MKLEEALTNLGNEPVSRLPNYRAVLAYINSSLKKVNVETVQEITTSDQVLEKIYSLDDTTLQEQILMRPIVELKGASKFRNILVYTGGLLTMFFVSMVIMSLVGGPLPPETLELFKTMGVGILEIAKALVIGGAT